MNERYCCAEHIDIALDDFVDCFQHAPELEKITEPRQLCHFCSRHAQYYLYHQPEEE